MKKYNLLVVAHPDDETIFFGGLLQVHRRRPWKVVCVTDGNADGQGRKRENDFKQACGLLKVKTCEMWGFPDQFEKRLDLERLEERLKAETPVEVFTHGILGEYGHPHHQDVSLAVHRSFGAGVTVWSTAYNAFAEKVFRLPRRAYEKKCEILSRIYFTETRRFAQWLPAHNFEGVVRARLSEVERLYDFLKGGEPPSAGQLDVYRWFLPYLEDFRAQLGRRHF
ncbi:MAG: PIG-L family deacetylase [Calothrix sp. SM1_5_4]|nr:PIG-L family deacetylase [Calothrix sp. SM1_5_4]